MWIQELSATCAGKTYTMQGPAADPGVNQRALLELFSATSGHEASPGADISVAMLEIYNEDVHDLLADGSARQLDVCALGPGQLPPGVQYTTSAVLRSSCKYLD